MTTYAPFNKPVLLRPVESGLDAAIRMVNQLREVLVPPGVDGHLECVDRQVAAQRG